MKICRPLVGGWLNVSAVHMPNLIHRPLDRLSGLDEVQFYGGMSHSGCFITCATNTTRHKQATNIKNGNTFLALGCSKECADWVMQRECKGNGYRWLCMVSHNHTSTSLWLVGSNVAVAGHISSLYNLGIVLGQKRTKTSPVVPIPLSVDEP